MEAFVNISTQSKQECKVIGSWGKRFTCSCWLGSGNLVTCIDKYTFTTDGICICEESYMDNTGLTTVYKIKYPFKIDGNRIFFMRDGIRNEDDYLEFKIEEDGNVLTFCVGNNTIERYSRIGIISEPIK